jgi:outer membrane protein
VRKIVVLFVLALAMLPLQAAAEQKIGYVDVPYLIDNSPQAKDASQDLEKQFGPKKQKLKQMQEEFQALKQKLQKDGLVMSEEKRQKNKQKLRELKRNIKQSQSAFREDLNMKRNNAFKEVRKVVIKAVNDLAEEKGFDLVVGQGAVYASDGVDLTQRVLERMKARYDGGSSE